MTDEQTNKRESVPEANRQEIDWQRSEAVPVLEVDEVHVWRAYLPQAEERLQQLLTKQELQRAASFYFEEHRRHWSAAHGILRYLLGFYTRREPLSISLHTNDYGKPAIAESENHNGLQFNLSHSHDYALYAFTYRRALGIDIEKMRTKTSLDALARHCFSELELQGYNSLPPDERAQVFYQCWSRKEAYIKGRGMGLALTLKDFDVSLLPQDPARLIASREDSHATKRWQMHSLPDTPGYASALIVEQLPAHPYRITCQQWQSPLLQHIPWVI